ncbi:O-antigen ligase family protein [Thalassotalea crassostreae]|uniref:O-antigen ligase family protein n=1 Tax=Thalassotalea crassostreae TaxID=1763536 RepID=UPI000838D346|nr:O-antigen ligase family protein [Thalassotalea crassostreae]
MHNKLNTLEQNSIFGFFFLYLYTLSVLVRPHEMFLISEEWIVIQIFAILGFLGMIIGQRPLKLTNQHYMLIAMLPLIVFSGLINGSGFYGVEQAQRLLISSILPLILYTNLLSTANRQRHLMFICILASVLMVHNGYSQHVNYDYDIKMGEGWAGSFSVGREEMRITYLGFFNDPNDLGMFLVMNIPFLAYFYSESGGLIKKLIVITAFAFILYGIYITGSRGTLLGALGVISLYFFLKRAGIKLVIFAIVMAPIAGTLIMSFGGLSSADSSADGRLQAWYDGIWMLLYNPVFGVGMGNFLEEHGLVAHNSYIHVASELGIIGYSLWGGALTLTTFTAYNIMKSTESLIGNSESNKSSLIGELKIHNTLFFSLIGYLVTAFFLSRMFTLLLFIFLGMTIASHLRLMRICPELKEIYNINITIKSMISAWVIIVLVYIALKIGL